MRKAKNWIFLLLALAVIIFFALFKFGRSDDPEILYAVTPEQWREAFGDKAYIQTIYRNVTIEICNDATQDQMILATSNGGLMLDNQAQDMKLICLPFESGFVSYVYQYSSGNWEKYNGKTDVVDAALNTYLPSYVDAAMAGLQDEFENASYDAAEKCYTITLQKSASSVTSSMVTLMTMHCKVFFEDGRLARLETEITGQSKQTLKLYNIGKTKVEAPVDGQNG